MTQPANPNAHDDSAPGSYRAALLKKKQLAAALNLSPRTIDNLQAQKKIPVIVLSSRLCRYDLAAVLRSLNRFQVEAVK